MTKREKSAKLRNPGESGWIFGRSLRFIPTSRDSGRDDPGAPGEVWVGFGAKYFEIFLAKSGLLW